jgi:hypothetical protein
MRKLKILGLVGALLGCTFLATASAATPRLNVVLVRTGAVDFTPAAEGAWVSWAQASLAHPNRSSVYIENGSGPKIKVNAKGTSGEGGGFDGNTFVYYQYRGQWAGDIHEFNLQTHHRSSFPAKVSTPWDEYYPTISGAWVLFTRYISRNQVTKVLLYNTQTHELRTLGTDHGSRRAVYSGQVNGDYAVWGRATPGGADVYLYRISTRTSTTVPRVGFDQYDPSVAADGTVYFGRSGNRCGAAVSLVRYSPDGVSTVLYNFPAGIDMGHSYVDEEPDGSLQVFFGQYNCKQKAEDIYKGIDSYSVSISKAGSGTGTVTSGPAGIDCGTACQSIFHGGLTVTFTATPDSGSVFSGWSDASCGANPTCVVSVESDVSLTATFDPSP